MLHRLNQESTRLQALGNAFSPLRFPQNIDGLKMFGFYSPSIVKGTHVPTFMLKESSYFHNEDQFGRKRGQGRRRWYLLNDYDMGHPADYGALGGVDRYMHEESRDSNEHLERHYGWEEHEPSSERMSNDLRGYDSYERPNGHYGWEEREVSSDGIYDESSDYDYTECPLGNCGREEHDHDYDERLKGNNGWEDQRISSQRTFIDWRDYDSYDYERLQGHKGRMEHRLPSEKMLEETAHLERRKHRRNDSADHVYELDMRHHLINKKLDKGLSSSASHDRARENHYDFKYWTPRGDYLPARGSAISKRLGGRIENPRRDRRLKCEQVLGRSTYLKRMQYPRAGGADRIVESGQGYNVSKQDFGDDLRSVVSHERACEGHDDHSHRTPRKDPFLLNERESMLGSQLQGIIKVPGRSTYSNNNTDRGRHWGRGSPERPQGRPRNGINIVVDKDLDNEGRTTRYLHLRSASNQIMNENSSKFARPKSIAMPRVRKSGNYEHVNDRPLLGKRKRSKGKGVHQKGEGDLSFEGPKPLGEILKRKRSADVAYYESDLSPKTSEGKNLDPENILKGKPKTRMTTKRT